MKDTFLPIMIIVSCLIIIIFTFSLFKGDDVVIHAPENVKIMTTLDADRTTGE